MSKTNEFKDQVLFSSNNSEASDKPFGLKFIESSDAVVEQELGADGRPTQCPTGTARATNTPRGTAADVDVDAG